MFSREFPTQFRSQLMLTALGDNKENEMEIFKVNLNNNCVKTMQHKPSGTVTDIQREMCD